MQVKTTESHGYNSVQVAYQPMKEKNVKKPMAGHFKKAGVPPMRHVCEFRLNDTEGFEVGQQLDIAEMFPEGAVVDVAGTTVGECSPPPSPPAPPRLGLSACPAHPWRPPAHLGRSPRGPTPPHRRR